MLWAAPAAAQLGGSISLDTDYRLRGYSLTGDRPALSAQLTYDHASGAYFNLSALAELDDGRFLGVVGNVGYAKRLSSRVSVDAGVLRSQIGAANRHEPSFRYTEVYAGAFVGPVMGRISLSPDYRMHGLSAGYGELETGFSPVRDWRVSAHVGMLVYLTSQFGYGAGSSEADWRIGVSRQFGRLEIHSALSGGGPSRYDGYRARKRTAATAGASLSF
jgi:uncharacterized protein (TIGR02001 family)